VSVTLCSVCRSVIHGTSYQQLVFFDTLSKIRSIFRCPSAVLDQTVAEHWNVVHRCSTYMDGWSLYCQVTVKTSATVFNTALHCTEVLQEKVQLKSGSVFVL